jgi:hypothetical protein
MISLAVSGRGRGVSVSRKVMEFCCSIVHTLWHFVLLASWMLSGGVRPGSRSSDHRRKSTIVSAAKPQGQIPAAYPDSMERLTWQETIPTPTLFPGLPMELDSLLGISQSQLLSQR